MTTARAKKGFEWRKWNNLLHRDIGYLLSALTVIYAISGVAVNHVADWNPNYKFEREEVSFTPFEPTTKDEVAARLVEELKLPGPPKDSFRSAPHKIELFYEGWSAEADIKKGWARVERPKDRFLLRDMNFLHLNHPKGLWTWFADAYAVLLAFLAISGLFMRRGKKGLMGRGKYFVLVGLLIPIVFVVVLRYL